MSKKDGDRSRVLGRGHREAFTNALLHLASSNRPAEPDDEEVILDLWKDIHRWHGVITAIIAETPAATLREAFVDLLGQGNLHAIASCGAWQSLISENQLEGCLLRLVHHSNPEVALKASIRLAEMDPESAEASAGKIADILISDDPESLLRCYVEESVGLDLVGQINTRLEDANAGWRLHPVRNLPPFR